MCGGGCGGEEGGARMAGTGSLARRVGVEGVKGEERGWKIERKNEAPTPTLSQRERGNSGS